MQPDSIIPNLYNPQSLNRYSYVLNNPIRYNDPTGHVCSDPDDPTPSCENGNPYPNNIDPLGDDDVVINNPGPLDDGQEQDDPTPGGGGNSDPSPMPNLDPIPATYLNTDYYQSIYASPLLPPSPFGCEWIDCALSVGSILASGISTAAMGEPRITGAMFIADALVTVPAIIRTENDYAQGKISNERRLLLDFTGGLGLIPSIWGLGLSVVNGMATFSGYPP